MDKILRTITSDGSLMASAIDSSQIVYTAQKIHGLTKTSCAALGRLLTGASLMGNMLKTDGASLTLKVNGGGPLGNLVAISDSHGNVRGYVDFPEVELPLKPNGKIDVGGGVGNQGRLAVIRDLGEGDPYVGQVELVSGEIAEDLTNYYASSEQVPTVCALGVLVDKESGEAMLSGGLLIQPCPGRITPPWTAWSKISPSWIPSPPCLPRAWGRKRCAAPRWKALRWKSWTRRRCTMPATAARSALPGACSPWAPRSF